MNQANESLAIGGVKSYNNVVPLGPKQIDFIPGEKLIFEVRPTVFVMAGRILFLAIGIGGLIAMFYVGGARIVLLYFVVSLTGIFVALMIFMNWYFTIFRLTNKRVENRYGVFGSREEQVALDDIQTVEVENCFWGMIFNFGTVVIKASGAHREVDFTNVASPKRVANRIEDMALGHHTH